MSVQEVVPEQFAELFHHYHQALALDFDRALEVHQESWEQMPERERNLLVSAARLALLELSSCNKKPETTRPYFADPEKAEWGC